MKPQKGAKGERKGGKAKVTPFKLFSDYNNLLGNKLSPADMRTEYNNLSIEGKFKYIQQSANMYPDVCNNA